MTVPITGLQAGEISQLARALGAGVLPPRAAQRLAQHTAGSPLLAGALLAEHGAARLSTAEGLAAYAPRSFSSVVLTRLAECATQGRELAMAGSVLGLRWPLTHAAELAGVADPLAAADEAVRVGLITVDHRSGAMPLGGFPHPLVRAALYRELTLARRAALHRAAAELAEDPRDALRHRVEAEIGPNPALAAELAAMASKEEADGSWATAGRTYLWAARVASGRADRERHVLNAAVSLLLAGDIAEAREVVDTAASFTDGARLHLARGYLAWVGAAFGAAEAELRTAYDLASEPDEREVAARAADLLSSLCVYLGRGAEGITWARRSLQTHPDPLPGGNPRNSVLIGHGIRGRMSEGLAEAARFESHRGGASYADGLMGRGTLRLWADDPAGARQDLLPVAETCLRHGPLETGMFAAVHLADAEWRLGLWDDALLHGEAAVSAAAQALHDWFAAEADAVAALPLIARGDWDAAEAHVRAAVAAAKRVGYGHATLWTIVARARLADARADPRRVVSALTPLLGFTAVDGVDHPSLHSWRELLGAALVALGRAGEAGEHAAVLERQAQRLELRSARARALRLRGLIEAAAGRYTDAIRLLDDALTEFEALPQPFDLALAEADLGACLRRAGRRRAAAQRLRHAEATLAQLGAAPYLARVRQELAACGLRPARDGVAAGEQLTPAEFAVARLVASGKSNREAATELVLSTKTVEHHLGRIYAKLRITSRTQLALRLADR